MKILNMLNFSPIFHISCDESFGAYSQNGNLRLSLLVVVLGTWKLYLITGKRGEGFKLLRVIRFADVCHQVNQECIDQKTASYAATIQEQNDQSLDAQLDFLKDGYESNLTAEASLDSRVSSYVSGYLVLIGFFAYLFDAILSAAPSIARLISGIIFLAGILFLLSSGAFLWRFLRVRNVVRSTFKDMKDSPTKCKRVELAYTNWYASKKEVESLASHVKNIEQSMASALCIAIMTWVTTLYINNPALLHLDFQPTTIQASQKNDANTNLTIVLQSLEAIKNEGAHPMRYIIGSEETKAETKIISDLLRLYAGQDRIVEITVNSEFMPKEKPTLILREE